MSSGINSFCSLASVYGDDATLDALAAVRDRGGVAFLSEKISYLGIPVDEEMALPLHVFDAPGERGLLVLFIAGDMAFLPGHFVHFREAGFTHLVWQRGFKPGTKRWRRATLGQFLKKLLHSHGSRPAGH